ncbi:MAG: ABC transporter permease [Gemmatimonadales bacterium]
MLRLYRFLLSLFPASFRQDFAADMEADFRRTRAEASGPVARGVGAVAAIWDAVRHAALAHWDIARQDLHFVRRVLLRNPGYALTAILVTAIGVGVNAAAFSVADFVLVRPLPFPEPDRLVKLWQSPPGYSDMELSPGNLVDWKAMSTSFEAVAGFATTQVNVAGIDRPERVAAADVEPGLFGLLGARPWIGRLFTEADAVPGSSPALVVSAAYWRDRLGSPADLAGVTLLIDGVPAPVIGVLPPAFVFPDRATDLWRPLGFAAEDLVDRANNYLQAVARLKPGVSVETARADLGVVAARLAEQFPEANEQTGATVNRLRDEYSQRSRLLLLTLVGASVCMLLIACANLANLLVARSLARRSELTVRAALGAGRERLARQIATEAVVLVGLGAAAGVALAALTVPLLARLVPDSLPLGELPRLDLRILGIAAIAALATATVVAVLAGRQVDTANATDVLRGGQRAGDGGRERLRSTLMATEVAASAMLLVTAGLLLRSVQRVSEVDPGFRPEAVLTARTALPPSRYLEPEVRARFYRDVLEAVRAVPGVRSAGYTTCLPMVCGGMIWPAAIDGDARVRAAANSASLRFVTPAFLATLGIGLERGRDVSDEDRAEGQAVAVVSRSFIERYWPGQDGLGKRFRIAGRERLVVGVTRDVRVRGPERTAEPQVYLPAAQGDTLTAAGYWPRDLVIRTDGRAPDLGAAVERIVHAIDPEQPVALRSMAAVVEALTATRNDQLRIVAALALIALVLAAVGLHGLLAFVVASRSRELGVRMALGADRAAVVRLVTGRAVAVVVAGLIPGLALSFLAARSIRAVLFGVPPADLVTYGVVIAVCLALGLVGASIPAWRAARLDPATTLRSD